MQPEYTKFLQKCLHNRVLLLMRTQYCFEVLDDDQLAAYRMQADDETCDPSVQQHAQFQLDSMAAYQSGDVIMRIKAERFKILSALSLNLSKSPVSSSDLLGMWEAARREIRSMTRAIADKPEVGSEAKNQIKQEQDLFYHYQNALFSLAEIQSSLRFNYPLSISLQNNKDQDKKNKKWAVDYANEANGSDNLGVSAFAPFASSLVHYIYTRYKKAIGHTSDGKVDGDVAKARETTRLLKILVVVMQAFHNAHHVDSSELGGNDVLIQLSSMVENRRLYQGALAEFSEEMSIVTAFDMGAGSFAGVLSQLKACFDQHVTTNSDITNSMTRTNALFSTLLSDLVLYEAKPKGGLLFNSFDPEDIARQFGIPPRLAGLLAAGFSEKIDDFASKRKVNPKHYHHYHEKMQACVHLAQFFSIRLDYLEGQKASEHLLNQVMTIACDRLESLMQPDASIDLQFFSVEALSAFDQLSMQHLVAASGAIQQIEDAINREIIKLGKDDGGDRYRKKNDSLCAALRTVESEHKTFVSNCLYQQGLVLSDESVEERTVANRAEVTLATIRTVVEKSMGGLLAWIKNNKGQKSSGLPVRVGGFLTSAERAVRKLSKVDLDEVPVDCVQKARGRRNSIRKMSGIDMTMPEGGGALEKPSLDGGRGDEEEKVSSPLDDTITRKKAESPTSDQGDGIGTQVLPPMPQAALDQLGGGGGKGSTKPKPQDSDSGLSATEVKASGKVEGGGKGSIKPKPQGGDGSLFASAVKSGSQVEELKGGAQVSTGSLLAHQKQQSGHGEGDGIQAPPPVPEMPLLDSDDLLALQSSGKLEGGGKGSTKPKPQDGDSGLTVAVVQLGEVEELKGGAQDLRGSLPPPAHTKQKSGHRMDLLAALRNPQARQELKKADADGKGSGGELGPQGGGGQGNKMSLLAALRDPNARGSLKKAKADGKSAKKAKAGGKGAEKKSEPTSGGMASPFDAFVIAMEKRRAQIDGMVEREKGKKGKEEEKDKCDSRDSFGSNF